MRRLKSAIIVGIGSNTKTYFWINAFIRKFKLLYIPNEGEIV